jgi:deoxyribonuclease IV
MPLLGAHMSVSGGYYKAVEAAAKSECDCVQIFTKNNNQWKAKSITDDDVTRFQTALQEHKIKAPLSHASYLINLASPDAELRQKSIDAYVIELQRAEALGISGVVLHPGSFTTSDEATGLDLLVDSLDQVFAAHPNGKTLCLLENTAGQGSNLGHRFEHLQYAFEKVSQSSRLGICFDTCHAWAAGYPLLTQQEFRDTMSQLDDQVGLANLRAIHLNDSKNEFGSHKDRHEHIGRGTIGLDPFRWLLNDARLVKVPMYLETPKEAEDGSETVDLDLENLQTLRKLID